MLAFLGFAAEKACKITTFFWNTQENGHKSAFFFKKIWSIQKFVVILHPLLRKRLLNGVMVALQILVLSVWVRVLVEQHRRDLMGLFLVLIPTQTQVLSPKGARLLLRNLRVLVLNRKGTII